MLDDKKRLALAALAFLGAAALFAACLALTAGVSILQPRAAARGTATSGGTIAQETPGTGPSLTATFTPSLPASVRATSPVTATQQITGTPSITATTPIPSWTPTLTPTTAPSPTFAPIAQDSWCIPWNSPSVTAQVVKVIDGVTIEVNLDGETVPVRYIGVDLLEFGDDASIWEQMTEKNQELVGDKTVLLIKDRSDVDSSGQLLRYVLAGSTFVNLEMVSSGFAVATSAPPNQSCDAMLLEAQMGATQDRRGLWEPTPTATRVLMPSPTPTPMITGPMVIGLIVYRGSPWQEPDEFVEVLNDGTEPIQLKDWTLSDDAGFTFTFPSFVLGPGQHCRIYTDMYSPTTCGFSFNRPSPIWENDQDCAYLKDPLGELISTYCYY